jgi:hypothetical protein
MILGKRIGPYYIGRCSRTHHYALLRSGRGTYCRWHRFLWLGWGHEVRCTVADMRRWLARRWKRFAMAIYEWIWP